MIGEAASRRTFHKPNPVLNFLIVSGFKLWLGRAELSGHLELPLGRPSDSLVYAPKFILVDNGSDTQTFTELRIMHHPSLAKQFQRHLCDLDGEGYGKGDRRAAGRAEWDSDEQPVAAYTTRLAPHLPVASGTLPTDVHRKFQRDANAGAYPVCDLGSLSHTSHPSLLILAQLAFDRKSIIAGSDAGPSALTKVKNWNRGGEGGTGSSRTDTPVPLQ